MKLRVMVPLALVLAFTACSKSEDKPGDKAAVKATRKATYTIGTFKASVEVPSAWKEEVGPSGEPSFTIPGRDFGVGPTLVYMELSGDDLADRMKSVIRMQYDEADLAAAKREDLSGDRVWISHTRADGYVHARMFLPAPGGAGILMCAAMFKPEHAHHLAAHRALCDSVTLQ